MDQGREHSVRAWITIPVIVLLVGSIATADPGNPIALTATYQASLVRGYTCGSWMLMDLNSRTSYLLGIIALADALQASGQVDDATAGILRLPLSAVNYRSLVDAGCAYLPPATPILAVLYTLK
jgi:hypothetical protein